MRGAHVELAIIGVLASLIGVYYYLRVVWAIYFTEPATAPLVVLADEPAPAWSRFPASPQAPAAAASPSPSLLPPRALASRQGCCQPTARQFIQPPG